MLFRLRERMQLAKTDRGFCWTVQVPIDAKGVEMNHTRVCESRDRLYRLYVSRLPSDVLLPNNVIGKHYRVYKHAELKQVTWTVN